MEEDRCYYSEGQRQDMKKQREKKCHYEEAQIEKKKDDDVMTAIVNEDKREVCHKREQTEIMRNEMISFQKEKVVAKEKQHDLDVIEDRKIEGQVQFAYDRGCAREVEKDRKMHSRDESDEKISTQMLADAAAGQDRYEDLMLHQAQECSESNIRGDIIDKAYFERINAETKEGLLSQMEDKKTAVKDEKQRDVDFRKSADSMMYKEDEKEMEKERIKKEKNAQYSVDLRNQIKDNAVRRENEKEDEKKRSQHEYDFYHF